MNEQQEMEIKTYRGASLEELLPLIRDELGSDAVIMRQREGVVGGVGGFFGKKCVEVDVRPPALPVPVHHGPAIPRGSVFDAYDTGSGLDADLSRFAPDDDEIAETSGDGDLMEALLAQSSPFADELEQAWGSEFFEVPGTAGEVLEDEPEAPVRAAAPLPARRGDDLDRIHAALAEAGIPPKIAESVVAEAEVHLRPFAADEPLAELVRRALARRVALDLGGRTPRRLALVGPAGAGRTLAAAKLCGTYSRSGLSVCALSLEPARSAFALAAATEPFGVALETADHPSTVELVRKRLRPYDVVVADTPPVDLDDQESLERVSGLLAALRPTEVILVLPADAPGDASRLLVRELRTRFKLRSLLVTHADMRRPGGTAVGLSLAERLPVSYVSDSSLAGAGIRPADADELTRMVLQ